MSRSCYRCLVSGRVQGVWYRASTQHKANELGISGQAMNLPDGRVEVVACGEQAALEALHQWLWEGPTAASVENVECERLAQDPGITDFRTG